MELKEEGLTKVGTWNSTEGITLNKQTPNQTDFDTGTLQDTHFRIITALVLDRSSFSRHVLKASSMITSDLDVYKNVFQNFIKSTSDFDKNFIFKFQTAPYTMLKETTINLSGNDRFEGFCIDLIFELSQILFFNYTFEIQEDGVYGKPGRNGKWTGMLGKVIDGVRKIFYYLFFSIIFFENFYSLFFSRQI